MDTTKHALSEPVNLESKKLGAEPPQGVSNSSKPSPASDPEPKNKGGRPKGSLNRTTRIIKDAVLDSFDRLGRCEYLVKMANGTASDRAAYMTLLGRVLPNVIEGDVDHKVRVELGWLSGRSIGQSDMQSVGHGQQRQINHDVIDAEPIGAANSGQEPVHEQGENDGRD